jgi:GAF domain-containing protein
VSEGRHLEPVDDWRLDTGLHSVRVDARHALLMESLADAVADVVSYDELVVYEVDADRRTLRPLFRRSSGDGTVAHAAEVGFDGATARAIEAGTPQLVAGVISVPLVHDGRMIGALNLRRDAGSPAFTSRDVDRAARCAPDAAAALAHD